MAQQEWDTDRTFTVPNVLSFLRLAAIPVFVWLILIGSDTAAIVLLVVSSVTDWFDGQLARRFHQTSKLGAQLDPITDRLYILATVIAFVARGIVPWQFLALLAVRDLLLLCLMPLLRRSGHDTLDVHILGKAGTFVLLMSLPLLLLGAPDGFAVGWARWLGIFIAGLGVVGYWGAGVIYVRQIVRLTRQAQA